MTKVLKCLSVGWWVFFEICFLKTDYVLTEVVYEYLELFIMDIITVYVLLYYCFHKVFGGAMKLDFAAIPVLMKILCPIQMNSYMTIQVCQSIWRAFCRVDVFCFLCFFRLDGGRFLQEFE